MSSRKRFTQAKILSERMPRNRLTHTLPTSAACPFSRTYFGSDTPTSVRITHVQPGSIDIQGFVEVAATLQSTLPALPSLALGVKDIPELIKQWLDILKFLKGSPPQKIQNVKNGNAVQIENISGENTVINGNIYNTFIFNDIGRDAAKLEAPVRRGAKRLDVLKGRRKIGSYTAADLQSFRSIRPQNKPIESEIEAILEVIAPVFEGEGVWRFRYGRASLTAKLMDEEYRLKVMEGGLGRHAVEG
jgi:hypothetical protein